MKLAIDIDGVICATVPLMVKAIEKRGFTVVFDRYNPYIDGIQDTEEFMYEVVEEVYSVQMDQIQPYEDTVKSIHLISRDLGFITFVTARREKFNDATLKWLHDHFDVSFDFINKPSSEKPSFILQEEFDVFIEDRLRTVNIAAELGIKTYLINRQWNTGRTTHKDIVRVNSLAEFYAIEMLFKSCFYSVEVK